jgi:hypothetical protein
MFVGPGHHRLPAVRAAVNAFPLATERQAPPPEHLRARLARAWTARHQSARHRDVIGAMLPDLIRDAQLAVRQADHAPARRSAQATLAEVYALAQFFCSYQPDTPLLWRVSDRGITAAQESEDPHAVGVAAWLAAHAHRDSGHSHYDAADAVTHGALEYLQPFLPDAAPEVLAIAGALTFEAGYTAARRGETGTAWRRWDEARAIAARLPTGYYHPITSFSQAIVGVQAVTIAVELHAGGESVRQAAAADADTIPSRPRRARHRIEAARGYQPDAALAALAQAHEAAPETTRYNGFAKRIVLEETEARSPARRRRASELAVRIGIPAA